MRLVRIATDHWKDIDGWAVGRNLPPVQDLSVDRFCNFVWWWATRNVTEQAEKDKFEARLWRPPVGVVPDRGPWSAEAESGAFSAFKAQIGR